MGDIDIQMGVKSIVRWQRSWYRTIDSLPFNVNVSHFKADNIFVRT